MAIVKSIDANLVVPRLNDSNYALDLVTIIGENNSAYIENEEQQTIWIGGQPHDSISLTPFYEKKALALANHKQNNVSAFSDGMVLASTPIAKCSHDNNFSTHSDHLSAHFIISMKNFEIKSTES